MNARRRTTGLAAAVLAAAALTCAAPALAAPPAAPAAGTSTVRVGAHEQHAAARFWTSARLRSATDVTATAVPAGRVAGG
ncbi:hypothetical protein L1885_28550, partial [Streptomyces fuscigenes]|nr:hypothetical protein [Streptomyces fuscigenes]